MTVFPYRRTSSYGRSLFVVEAGFRPKRRGKSGLPKLSRSSAGGAGTGRRDSKKSRNKKIVERVPKKFGFQNDGSKEPRVHSQGPSLDAEHLLESVDEDLYDEDTNAKVKNILSQFEFPLDDFQEKSLRYILRGQSVVVCAPTGAGKTAIAEAAATHFLKQGGKVIYTTPLKALSNQKLLEMRDRFGEEQAGLQTGDTSINPDGNIVVMTTEILRNILYRVEEEQDEVSSSTSIVTEGAGGRLDGVKLVVFDECHYLGDPARGSVWEESIINLPPDVIVLAMSATVKNPNDISGWISEVHGPCSTVITKFRPVPLKWHYCLSPGKGEVTMLPLLDASESGINPRLIAPTERVESFAGSMSSWDVDDENDITWGGSSTWGRWDVSDIADSDGEGNSINKAKDKFDIGKLKSRTLDELINVLENSDPWHKLSRRERVPPVENTIAVLSQKDMLPAIWFIFSRKDCESAVKNLAKARTSLTSQEERKTIQSMVESLRETQPEAVKEDSVDALLAGIAAHHAGCLPGWKLIIERLFQKGLIKIVFATETLAAGINMPARTTLLTSLSKRRDDGISLLKHNELMQMAGRAGRRGYDVQGHCVIVQSRWDNPDAAWSILRKGPESLESKFATNYGMALNLLRTRTLQEAKQFLSRSFSMYLANSRSRNVLAEIAKLEERAQQVLEKAGCQPVSDQADIESNKSILERYEKLQGRKREEKRALKLLRSQLAEERGYLAECQLAQTGIPQAIGIDLSGTNINDSGYSLPALVVGQVDKYGAIQTTTDDTETYQFNQRYLCLGADNNIYIVHAFNIAAIAEDSNDQDLSSLWLAASEVIRARASSLHQKSWITLEKQVLRADGSPETASMLSQCIPSAASMLPIVPSQEGIDALEAQKRRIRAVRAEIDDLKGTIGFTKASKKRAAAFTKAGKLLDEASMLRSQLDAKLSGGWKQFERIIRVLETTEALYRPSTEIQEKDNFYGDANRDIVGNESSFSLEDQDGSELRYQFAPLGLVSRELRGSNELWMALALTHPSLQSLAYPQLAAVVSSIVSGDAVSKLTASSAYPPSLSVSETISQLEEVRSELSLAQIQAGIDFPLCLDPSLSGVVEAWASGLGWAEVTGDCNLDDGDVARLLMRTVDALRQAAFCDHLLPPLRSAARTAARRMNRPPISELFT